MAQIGSWNGHTFEVSANFIRGFTDLTVKGSCETKDKKQSKQKFVKRKNSQPAEIGLTVSLNALTGVTDVRGEAIAFVKEAAAGKKAYFYIGTAKLVTAKVMLVDASVDNVQFSGPNWVSCDVKLTLKQAGKATNATSSKSAKKKSVRKKSTKKKATSTRSATKKTATSGTSVRTATAAAKQTNKSAKSTSKLQKQVAAGFKTGVNLLATVATVLVRSTAKQQTKPVKKIYASTYRK